METLPDRWWYDEDSATEWRPPGTYLNPGEPDEVFYGRMRELLAYLRAKLRGGGRVALVAHWATLYALSGKSLGNAECIVLAASELAAEPYIIPSEH